MAKKTHTRITSHGDTILWIIYAILLAVSMVAVSSSVGLTATTHHASVFSYIFKHFVTIVVALLATIVTTHIKSGVIKQVGRIGFYLTIAMVFVTTFILHNRFLIRFGGNSFQPSEMLKIAVIVYLASYLASAQDKIKKGGGTIRSLIIVAASFVAVVTNNLSTAIIIITVGLILMYFGNIKKNYILGTAAVLLVCAIIGSFVSFQLHQDKELLTFAVEHHWVPERAATWGSRIGNWIAPDTTLDSQENMARMAVAKGGVIGNGIGSTVQARVMAEAENDFIYAIIIEETGLIGGLIVFILYLLLFRQSIAIAQQSKDMFGKLVVAGLATSLFLQALINMLVTLGVIPVTGQPLPFIARGGSSLLWSGVALGIIQSVAVSTQKKEGQTN